MTDKDKRDLIDLLLDEQTELEKSIAVLETKIRCEKEHLLTIDNVLNNLQN